MGQLLFMKYSSTLENFVCIHDNYHNINCIVVAQFTHYLFSCIYIFLSRTRSASMAMTKKSSSLFTTQFQFMFFVYECLLFRAVWSNENMFFFMLMRASFVQYLFFVISYFGVSPFKSKNSLQRRPSKPFHIHQFKL